QTHKTSANPVAAFAKVTITVAAASATHPFLGVIRAACEERPVLTSMNLESIQRATRKRQEELDRMARLLAKAHMNRRIYCTVLIATLFGELAAFNPQARAQDGVPLWTNRYNRSTNLISQASAIAVDSSGNVLVTGALGDTARDFATIKYSGAGVPL